LIQSLRRTVGEWSAEIGGEDSHCESFNVRTCGEFKELQAEAVKPYTSRVPFVAAGAVTGIGSLPFTSSAEAVRAVAELSPEVPFRPQMPQRSQQESVVGQGVGIVENVIERTRDMVIRSKKANSIRYSNFFTKVREH